MDVEIVLDQHDGLGVREVAIGQIFQDVSVVDGGGAVRRSPLPPVACVPGRSWKGLDDPAVAPAFAGLRDIGLQQNARLQQPLRRALSFADQRLQMLAFPRVQPHHILLYRNVLSRHARLRRQIATEANHRSRHAALDSDPRKQWDSRRRGEALEMARHIKHQSGYIAPR